MNTRSRVEEVLMMLLWVGGKLLYWFNVNWTK